jgi:hypothetical protein
LKPRLDKLRRTKLPVNLLFALGATLLSLLMAEAGMRLYHVYVKALSHFKHADNPSVVFVRKPHADPEINSLGFRDHEYATEKPAGAYRIIVLGDSVTNGYLVQFEDMYVKRLESLLNGPGGKYEVISFGMNQYSTAQEVALFKDLGLRMRPDLVIVAYVLNDPTPDGNINDFFRRDRAPSLALEWLIRKLKILFKIPKRYNEIKGCRHFDYFSEMHCDADKWAVATASLRELGELSRKHGFQVLLVIFPLMEHDDNASFETYRWKHIHQRVTEQATENGFYSLDLLPYFAEHRPAELKAVKNDMLHPNGLANRIAAGAIHWKLIGLGIAPRKKG